jgi:polyhydroxyalkanoate synthase subunit PhaE
MQTMGPGTFFRPEEAYAAAAERFFELMKTFGMTAGGTADWKTLAAPLAAQFERWLQMSQGAAPWLNPAAQGAPGGFSLGAASAAFGPLPLGPAAVQGGQAQRALELFGRLAQLQAELAKHWSEIAGTAAQRFIARLGSAPAVPTTPQQALKLYELWVNCAEEAYAATVHKEDFSRLQAELANTSAALFDEQRQQAESLIRAWGLPTRSELDALHRQLKELHQQLAELARAAGAPRADTSADRSARRERTTRPKKAGAGRPPSGKRSRARRPRR